MYRHGQGAGASVPSIDQQGQWSEGDATSQVICPCLQLFVVVFLISCVLSVALALSEWPAHSKDLPSAAVLGEVVDVLMVAAPNLLEAVCDTGETALHKACSSLNDGCFRALIKVR